MHTPRLDPHARGLDPPGSPPPVRQVRLRDRREVTLRPIDAGDAHEIQQAFDRLSALSRYNRFMRHKKRLDPQALERGVRPRPGRDFAFVATVAAADGFDIVGAAQYVRADEDDARVCEFSVTVAEDWRRCDLAATLITALFEPARRDGYAIMEGWVAAGNDAMLALARKLGFTVDPAAGEAGVLHVWHAL